MYCKYCGKEIDDNAKFCNYCGKEVINKNTSSIQFDVEDNEESKRNIVEVFKESYDKASEEVNEKNKKEMIKTIKGQLKSKDGNIHVILIGIRNEEKMYNIRSTSLIDNALEIIQSEGYEIVDIKIATTRTYGIKILIMYK